MSNEMNYIQKLIDEKRQRKTARDIDMANKAKAELAAKDETIASLKADIALREQAQRGAMDALRLAREALQKIAKMDAPTFGEAFGRCVDIARAALTKATP